MQKNIKNYLQNKNGITLIALTITLIILMIIAGLTISATIGGNGLISRIQQAQQDFEDGKEEEQAKLQETKNKLGMVVGDIDAGKTATEGNSRYTDNSGKKAVVPQGFTVSGKEGEQDINNGLVIYNTNGQEVTDWDAVDKTTYDQWVWIPVENVNDMYVKNSSGVLLTGSTGVKTNFYSKSATLGNRTITRTSPGDTEGFREPDLVRESGYDYDNYEIAGFSSIENMANSLVNDYKEMLESVKKFGGFYVGRYELTGSVDNPKEKLGTAKNNITWYEAYKACKNFGINNDSIETRMIWGNQWDEICKFISTKGDKVDLDDSRSYGNYTDSIAPANVGGYGTRQITGFSEYWKVNNIYDFAGNLWEWDQEAFKTWARANRGGDYGYYAYSDGSSVTKEVSTTATGTLQSLTTRPTMYLRSTSSSLEQLKKTGEYVTKKTTVKDSDGNKVVIPQGFKVAEDSGKNITEGIVIEDDDIIEGIGNNRGNQYVWVPVSNIDGSGNNKIKLNDGSEVEITLGRYSFDTTTGEETLVQKGSQASEVTSSNYSDSSNDKYKINSHYELSDAIISDGSTTNTTAQNLSGFIESIKNNNGFYIARYEATYGEDGKANSKKSDTVSQWSPSRTEGSLWNKISEIDSSVACQNLYTGKANSDLLNSYAWDTTIKYLQSAGYTNYSNKIDGNGSIRNTGNTTDIACKIYDMAGNVFEWTTEIYGEQNNGSLVGGCFGYTTAYTSNRGGISPWGSYGDDGFRPILWI